MTRLSAPVMCLLLLATAAPVAHADDPLSAPVYYVQYEVSMKVDHTGPSSSVRGATTTAWKIERVFESTVELDMRSEGQVLSMVENNQLDPEKLKKMSVEEQLKFTQQMMDAMQYTANWMPGPPEPGDESDAMMKHMQAVSVPVRINYACTTTGSDLVNETGDHYDFYEQTTAAFSGGHVYTSPDQAKFELNTATRKYWLSLPFTYQDMNTARNDLEWLTVTKYRAAGTTAWGPEERKTDESSLERVGESFTFDRLPNGAQMPLVTGTLDASGKISGAQSFTGRLSETGDIPVTLTFEYTVTPTPPAKAAGAK